jgi:hypothetical protein
VSELRWEGVIDNVTESISETNDAEYFVKGGGNKLQVLLNRS